MVAADWARRVARAITAVVLVVASSSALAQDTKIAFQLDWRFEGPSALFLLAKAKGYFAQEKLDVTIDAGRRAFPIFARANGIDPAKVAWTSMDPPLRETMLVRGDVDAITGFYFTSLLNLNARGVKDEEVDVMQYPQHGVALYGNAIIASEQFIREKPEAVRGFLRAFTKAAREVIADPDGAIRYVKERDALVDEALEKRRLRLAITSVIATPAARTDGFGGVQPARLADMVTQVSQAFELKSAVKPEQVWNESYLPAKAERMIFGK